MDRLCGLWVKWWVRWVVVWRLVGFSWLFDGGSFGFRTLFDGGFGDLVFFFFPCCD